MPTIELLKGMPPGMTSARRALPGMPPGMLALSTGLGGPNVGDESDGYRNPGYPDHEDIGEGPWNNHTDMMQFHDHELHPDLAEASIRDVDSHGRWHILVPSALRQQISESGQQDVLTPTHAVHGPAEPDFHDPAHPKVTVWHNDIAYTVPVHPRALSPEHMQALADYEVHRRQHEKLEQQLRGERDAFGDRRPDLNAEESDRLNRSQRQLNHLHSIMRGAGTAAVGTINPYHKFVRRKFYQAVRQSDLSPREYRGQVLPDREAAIESMYPERRSNRQGQLPSDMKVEEFPGIWSIVDHHGKVTHSGLTSHPYSANFGSPYWREQVLADARNKNLVANRLHHLFGDPPDIDMSKLPISTYGKARKKTAEWFSNQGNLPPGMVAMAGEPLELAATEMVDQPDWEPSDDENHPQGIIKDIPLGGTDRIRITANPYMHLDEGTESARNQHGMAYPHSIGFTRHDGPDDPGTDEITGGGKAGAILSHASMAIAELLHANPPPMSLHFAARGKSRNRAYRHLMQRAANSDLGNGKYEFIEQVLDEPDLHAYHIIHHKVKKLPQYKNPLDVMQSESPIGEPLGLAGTDPVEQDDAYFNIVHKSVADQSVHHGMQTMEIGADSTPQPSSGMPAGMLHLDRVPSAGT